MRFEVCEDEGARKGGTYGGFEWRLGEKMSLGGCLGVSLAMEMGLVVLLGLLHASLNTTCVH